jgi:hypothetical protein
MIEFSSFLQPEEDNSRTPVKELRKASLTFTDGAIRIANGDRWEQVAISARPVEGVSPMMSSLEAIHGHLNESTPRHTSFWASTCRLVEQIDRALVAFPASVRHNFDRAVRISREPRCHLDKEMREQIAFYGSTRDACPCGVAVHYEPIFDVDVPCPHRFSLGTVRPKLAGGAGLELRFIARDGDPSAELRVVCQCVRTIPADVRGPRRAYREKRASNNIRHFSRSRRPKLDIENWLRTQFPGTSAGGFALGYHCLFSA